MSTAPSDQILFAKATQGKRARESRIVTTAHGLQLGLARAGEDLWGLDVACSDVTQSLVDQQTALSHLDEDSLFLVLTAVDTTHALVAIERTVLAALIEIQTLGRVHETPLEKRPYTPTDAAMAWLYLDCVIRQFANSVEDREISQQISGYFLEENAEDLRAAGLWLPLGDYQLFSAKLDIARGKRAGSVQLLMPHRDLPPPKVEHKPTNSEPVDNGFGLLPICLETVFTKVRMPLSMACNLSPGDFIPMPPDILNQAQLHAANGFVVASGKLGQMNGLRALRLGDGFMLSQAEEETPDHNTVKDFDTNLGDPSVDAALAATEQNDHEAFNPNIFSSAEESDLNDLSADMNDTNADAPSMLPVGDLPLDDDESDFGGMMDLDAIEAMIDDS